LKHFFGRSATKIQSGLYKSGELTCEYIFPGSSGGVGFF
jgi:hypothetical protein